MNDDNKKKNYIGLFIIGIVVGLILSELIRKFLL